MDNYQNYRATKDKKVARENVRKFCETRVRTTMIGSIQSLEEGIEKLSEDQSVPKSKLMEFFNDVRNSILDKGNFQLRMISNELEKYDIVRTNYYYLPLDEEEGDNNEGNK